MKRKDIDDLNKRRIELINSGNFEEAIKCSAEVARLDPNNVSAFNNWGNALYNLAKIKQDESLYRESCEKYERAAQLKPDYVSAFYNWGNALSDLALIKQDESLFVESCEKYEKAAQLKPNYVSAFYNWGIALSNLAKIKQDESLFMESCEKYERAAQLKPDHANAFNNWGIALSGLAKIKQDESLYRESCEKYERAAQLKPDYASSFYNWGNALSGLALIKQDESLYREACEKYERAAQLKPDHTSAFNNWGNALFYLALIEQDESLFREACEKYERAAQIKPDHVNAFNNWGIALSDLAKIKQDETLFREACEKYEKVTQLRPDDASAFYNWGIALYDLAKIKHDESLYSEAAECFKNSKMDILDILVSFDDKKDSEYIAQTDILFPLLDLDTDDGRFFKEATKSTKDKMKLDKYKKVYILSIFVISQLHVNNENEKIVAHYREKTISQKMLFEDSKFWLTAINYSNDLKEGKTLFDYLFEKEKLPTDESLNRDYSAFAGCFTFNYDSLNQFRLYGKEDGREGTGLSLVFRDSFFSKEAKMAMKQLKTEDGNVDEEEKHALFRCIYIDPETKRVETVGHKDDYLFYREKSEKAEKTIDKYKEHIDGIVKTVSKNMRKLKRLVKNLDSEIVGQLLLNLRYLTKHIAFKEEQECRILKIFRLNDEKIEIKISDDFKQMYVEYKPKVSNHIEKIIFGPKAAGMELFQDILTRKRLTISYEESKNPLA
jgi:tetratricopeptide (TPR) repeat protein/chaperonin cofactor prefoldin